MQRGVGSPAKCDLLELLVLCPQYEGEREQSGFAYQYSVFQLELSRNVLFQRGTTLDEGYRDLIERTRQPLDHKQLQTIFGHSRRAPDLIPAIDRWSLTTSSSDPGDQPRDIEPGASFVTAMEEVAVEDSRPCQQRLQEPNVSGIEHVIRNRVALFANLPRVP